MTFAFLPAWLAAIVFVVLTSVVSLAIYGVTRWLLLSRIQPDTHDLAASVLFRIGALHALILALAFAQEQTNYVDVLESVDAEVAALTDVYDDLQRYRGADLEPLRVALKDYVGLVAGGEWRRLASGGLSQDAWARWREVYEGVLDLEPQTARQITLRDAMIQDLQTISDARKNRELATLDSSSVIFTVAAAAGLVFAMIAYFPFRPSLANLVLLIAFAAYTGLVFFFILAMSNPFAPPVSLEPNAFKALAAEWNAPPGG